MTNYRQRLRHAREKRQRARLSEVARTPGSWKIKTSPEIGLTLLLNTDDYIDFLIDQKGNYEPATAAAIAQALEGGIGAFIDVGSHMGLHSLQVARRFPETSILSIEPLPDNAGHQRANMLINGLTYDLREVAASDSTEELILYMGRLDTPDVDFGKYNSGFASVVSDNFHDPNRSIKVPAATLDELAAGLDLRHGLLVKIDAEGAEPKVLAGMPGLVTDVPRMSMVIELLFDRWPRECAQIEANLRDWGFGMHDITGRTLEADETRNSANYLFTRG